MNFPRVKIVKRAKNAAFARVKLHASSYRSSLNKRDITQWPSLRPSGLSDYHSQDRYQLGSFDHDEHAVIPYDYRTTRL